METFCFKRWHVNFKGALLIFIFVWQKTAPAGPNESQDLYIKKRPVPPLNPILGRNMGGGNGGRVVTLGGVVVSGTIEASLK